MHSQNSSTVRITLHICIKLEFRKCYTQVREELKYRLKKREKEMDDLLHRARKNYKTLRELLPKENVTEKVITRQILLLTLEVKVQNKTNLTVDKLCEESCIIMPWLF